MVVYNISQRISACALKCSKQILSRELSPIVCSTWVSSHRLKAFHRLGNQAFPTFFFKMENCFRSSGFEIQWPSLTHAPTVEAFLFFNSLMEMTSSVADIIKFQFEL